MTEAGIPASVPTTHARIIVDLSNGHDTGLAIANHGNYALTVFANAYGMDGTTRAGTGTGTIVIPPGGHSAAFARQIVAGLPEGFAGVLDCLSCHALRLQ